MKVTQSHCEAPVQEEASRVAPAPGEDVPTFVPGIYRHYKGKEYMALMLVENEASREVKVVYIPLYPTHNGTARPFERPLSEWFQRIGLDDGRVLEFRHRFTLLTPIGDPTV